MAANPSTQTLKANQNLSVAIEKAVREHGIIDHKHERILLSPLLKHDVKKIESLVLLKWCREWGDRNKQETQIGTSYWIGKGEERKIRSRYTQIFVHILDGRQGASIRWQNLRGNRRWTQQRSMVKDLWLVRHKSTGEVVLLLLPIFGGGVFVLS